MPMQKTTQPWQRHDEHATESVPRLSETGRCEKYDAMGQRSLIGDDGFLRQSLRREQL
jgi:hypothetical protein